MPIRPSHVAAYGSLGLLGLLLHWVIAQVFPLGIITADTYAYFLVSENFGWLKGAFFDWQRTPPFGWLLTTAVHFSQPTVFVFWVHASLYALNSMLMLWALRPLWACFRHAWLAAFSLFVLDVAIMRVPFYSLYVTSDPAYTHTLLAGLLLFMGGFFRRATGGYWFMVGGYALLGIAAFIRDAGLAVLPVMLVFACICAWMFLREGGRFVRVAVWYVLCCTLLIAPTFLWSVRNAIVHDSFKATAAAGRTLLPAVLDFTGDGEQILLDPVQNNVFTQEIQIIRSEFPSRTPETYRWYNAAGRQNLFLLLYSFGDSIDSGGNPSYVPITAERVFKADSVALHAAVDIIRRHPLPFLRQTLLLYLELCSPATLSGDYHNFFDLRAARTYESIARNVKLTEVTLLLYPETDLHDVPSHPAMARMLRLMRADTLHTILLPYRVILMAIAIHAVALFHGCCFLFARTRRARDIGFIGGMLIAVVLSHHLLATVVGQVWDRYALPGEIPLRVSFLLACCSIVPACMQIIRSHRRPIRS